MLYDWEALGWPAVGVLHCGFIILNTSEDCQAAALMLCPVSSLIMLHVIRIIIQQVVADVYAELVEEQGVDLL